MKNILKIVKVLTSVALIIYLLSLVRLDDLAVRFKEADIYMLLLHFLLAFNGIVISAFKWKILCSSSRINSSLHELIGLYLVGMFYNYFLPTSVGGDFFRGLGLARTSNSTRAEAFASIFVERYTGLATLIFFVIVSLPFDERFYSDTRVLILTTIMASGFFVGSWMILSPALVKYLDNKFQVKIAIKVLDKVRKFQDALFFYRNHGKTLMAAFFVSILFYLNAVFIVYTGLMAFGITVNLGSLFIAIPVMMMLFMLPISLGGIGLQEWAHTFVMSIIGVPVVIGVGLGLLFRVRSLFFGLIGGFLVLFRYRGNLDPTSER